MNKQAIITVLITALAFDSCRPTAQLFHPLNLVTYLFSKPEIIACQQVTPAMFLTTIRLWKFEFSKTKRQ